MHATEIASSKGKFTDMKPCAGKCRKCGAEQLSFADAYQGAMEEVAIWKRRALEAEDMNRKFIAEINGPTHMGEPAQPAPSVQENQEKEK